MPTLIRSLIVMTWVGLLSVLSSSCVNSQTAKVAPPMQKILFFDQSDSVRDTQRAQWLRAGLAIVRSLHAGDSLYIFGLHDHTGEAAPLFMADIPGLAARPTSEQLRRYKTALKQAVAAGQTAVKNALDTATPSNYTDVFSAFDRYHVDPAGRPAVIFLFTDVLHVTKEFNMERQPLHDRQFPELISTEARRHQWTDRTLAGATVFVVLPSAERGDSQHVANDRFVLQRFYGALVNSLGGRLVRFDTYLEAKDQQ